MGLNAYLDSWKSSLEYVVSRPLSGKSLTKVEGWHEICIRELSESSSDWFDFDDDVIFRNSRPAFLSLNSP